MVKKVEAWQASDGSVHTDEVAAARHDASIQLEVLEIFNLATRVAALDAAEQIVAALLPYTRAVEKSRETPIG